MLERLVKLRAALTPLPHHSFQLVHIKVVEAAAAVKRTPPAKPSVAAAVALVHKLVRLPEDEHHHDAEDERVA